MSRVNTPSKSVRFEAKWLEEMGSRNGEHDPDLDEYSASQHATRDDAERAAIEDSKKAGACEWIAVTEQEFDGREWMDRKRWTGDWDGLSDDVTIIEEY